MPNPVYTLKEKQEWLKYHHQGESPEMVSKHFHRLHPDRPKPSKNTIRAALKRFEDTGRFDRSGSYTQPKKAIPLDKRVLVCAAVEAGGGCASASAVARQFDLSESSVRKIWKEEGFGDGSLRRITIGTSRKRGKSQPIQEERAWMGNEEEKNICISEDEQAWMQSEEKRNISIPEDCDMIEQHWLAALTNDHVTEKETKCELKTELKTEPKFELPSTKAPECKTAQTET